MAIYQGYRLLGQSVWRNLTDFLPHSYLGNNYNMFCRFCIYQKQIVKLLFFLTRYFNNKNDLLSSTRQDHFLSPHSEYRSITTAFYFSDVRSSYSDIKIIN